MKKAKPSKLLRGAMAALLACSLMLPTAALAADGPDAEPSTTAIASSPILLSVAADLDAQATAIAPGSGSFTIADFTLWPVDGSSASKKDFVYDAGAKRITVNTDEPFAIQNTNQATNEFGYPSSTSAVGIFIPAERDAHITLAGVGIQGAAPLDLATGASCSLVLADGSKNSFVADNSTAGYRAVLHCGTGSSLAIDDSVANRTSKGTLITPADGLVPKNPDLDPSDPAALEPYTLANGTKVQAGDPLSKLDSNNPGDLYAHHIGDGMGAAIGSPRGEAGGNITINGGIVTALVGGSDGWAAGIGSGGAAGADGTGPDEWITINGGRVTAQGGYHGPGIGGGPVTAKTGNIRINGGYVVSNGGAHGRGFGTGCDGGDSSEFEIILTGGTLLPTGGRAYKPADIGAPGAKVTITGGSIGNSLGVGSFIFDGTAANAKGEPIEMVEVDLTADVGANTYAITDWRLLVDGEPYDYGAPAEFDKGHLYLWLPQTVKKNSEITVEFTYRNTDKLDENNQPTEITPLPLFRPPDSKLPAGAPNDGKLRRYADFTLPQEYLSDLRKYYDGEPFKAYVIDSSNKLPTLEEIGKDPTTGKPLYRELTDGNAVTYKYQLFDKLPDGDEEPEPIGLEVDSGKAMPTDVGTMKFTMTSTEYSGLAGFKESYWGHRATGWCVIEPTNSSIELVRAQWVEDSAPGSEHHDSDKELRVHARIGRGATDPAGAATKPTCASPEGYVQLFVDEKAVGEPIKLVFKEEADAARTAGEALAANAERTGNDAGGHFTDFTYVFRPSDADFLVPIATSDGNHEVSVQYLPPKEDDEAPANYLASVNPADEPEKAPSDTVAISPIDPKPTVEPDTDGTDPDAPKPTLTVSPDPEPADPAKPNQKVYKGAIEAVYQPHEKGEPNPGRISLKLDTPSSGPITVTAEDGSIITAEVVRDENGDPVRDKDGKITLLVDPETPGKTKLTVRQEPNGAYTGTVFEFAVTVKPNPKIAPRASVSKAAENLTHPNGPTQPGDRIRYTVTAANGAPGSSWNGVVASDALPACLALDESTVHLANPSAAFDDTLSETSSPAPSLGEFALTAPGKDGRRTLTAPTGAILGPHEAILTFECTVAADAAGRGVSSDLANVARAEGSRTDPDDPTSEMPVDPDPSAPALPPGPGTVVPADPQTAMEKAVENVTEPNARVTRLGDRLRYTVTLENNGPANSCLVGAVISDPLPAGMELAASSIRLALAGARSIAVPDAAYDASSRTIAVAAGDLWGGERAQLTFEVTVGEEALGADNANVAFAHGTVPSEGPDSVPTDPDPGTPAPPPTGEPVLVTDPTAPTTIVGNDPAKGDIAVEKTAENTTHDDGKTYVGDTVRYRIELSNGGPATSWMDAVIRDDVPAGLEPVSGSIEMELPDGSKIAVTDEAYNYKTRRLSVAAGHLYGGQTVTLAFDALVTEEAVGADIGNVASALGVPPSRWDPGRAFPNPGSPFDPPEGWEAFGEGRETVESPAAYPPGTDEKGGVLPAEDGAKADDSTTIKRTRLAQTGDALIGMAAFGAAMAFASLTVLALARRQIGRES